MWRTIYWAILALLAFTGAALPQSRVAPRAQVKVIVLDRYCRPYLFPPVAPAPVLYSVNVRYPASAYSAPTFIPAPPSCLLLGSVSTVRPQLVFKDGTSYTVADYWRENDQLHFITLEEGGTKSVPHTVAFDTLDLARTKQAAGAQGFHFVLRDEPLDKWLEHHDSRENPRTRTGENSRAPAASARER